MINTNSKTWKMYFNLNNKRDELVSLAKELEYKSSECLKENDMKGFMNQAKEFTKTILTLQNNRISIIELERELKFDCVNYIQN